MKRKKDMTKEDFAYLDKCAEELEAEAEKYERGELGMDHRYTVVESMDQYKTPLKEKVSIHIRDFPVELQSKLRVLALRKRLSFASYVRMVLQEHVNHLQEQARKET